MESNNYNFRKEIKKRIEERIQVKESVIIECVDAINEITEIIINALKNGKKILWCGNGGSAADAQHLACEFVSKFFRDRKPLKSIALTTNTCTLTAISNDYKFDKIFERQVEALADKGDILIGMTTSGESNNIINALKAGNKKGVVTVAMTGKKINMLKDYADYVIPVNSDVTPYVQESHIMIGHIICYLVEETLFGDKTWETKQSLLTETAQ